MKLEALLIFSTLLFKNTGCFLYMLFYLYLTDASGSAVKQVTVGKNKNEYIHGLCPHLEKTKLVYEIEGIKITNYVLKCLNKVNEIRIHSRKGEGRGSGVKIRNKATTLIMKERPYC